MAEEQARTMVGGVMYEYITSRFVKSDDRKSLELAGIRNDYISYLYDNRIEDPKPYLGYNGYNSSSPPLTISKGGTSNLKKAMACCGFDLYESHGKRYYNPRLTNAALKNWKPEARVI